MIVIINYSYKHIEGMVPYFVLSFVLRCIKSKQLITSISTFYMIQIYRSQKLQFSDKLKKHKVKEKQLYMNIYDMNIHTQWSLFLEQVTYLHSGTKYEDKTFTKMISRKFWFWEIGATCISKVSILVGHR